MSIVIGNEPATTITIDEKFKSVFTKSRPGVSIATPLSVDIVEFILEIAEKYANREDLEVYRSAIIKRNFPFETILLFIHLCDSLGYLKLFDASTKVLSDNICATSEDELRIAFDVTNDFSPEVAKELDRERQFLA